MRNHSYDPFCPCNYCCVTAWHLCEGMNMQSATSIATAVAASAKIADVVALPPKPPGEVIYVDFKTRKRV